MSTTVVTNSSATSNPDIAVSTREISGAVYQEVIQGLVNFPFDDVVATPDFKTPTTIQYYLGGNLQCTLTYTYTGGIVSRVVRS